MSDADDIETPGSLSRICHGSGAFKALTAWALATSSLDFSRLKRKEIYLRGSGKIANK
jgi:hypothetical protein